ncbi:MAG TPA: hypothetical protein H9815_01675 [Candidatus Ruania gallistercoris]|uniref:Uncharacterized protein n=1 Tax=Candidatus Ruania gallistercoris TaxID=2838746 RepID=A0A9D2EBB1_9MICO|nr:hypothetical protein [Candidatus Ruania gallistercoris]
MFTTFERHEPQTAESALFGVLSGLRVSLLDIAETARVKRPVVSIWRQRYADGPDPFPRPLLQRGQQPLFSAAEVAAWVERTGRGNNSEFAIDLAIRGFAHDDGAAPLSLFGTLTALLRVKASSGAALAALTPEEILDLADDVDPEDADSFAEVAAAGAELTDLAALADVMADAAYTPAAALESLLTVTAARSLARDATRPVLDLDEPVPATLTPVSLRLIAAIAAALHTGGTFTVADPDPGRGDLLTAVLGDQEHLDRPVAVLPDGAGRLMRRRLSAHGYVVQSRDLDQGFGADALVVTAMTAEHLPEQVVLEQIEDIALRLAPGQRALVLGPARALLDAAAGPGMESVRSQLLRTDKVRAAVLLPAGLVPERSRERLALWVLGDAHPQVPIRSRWVMVADVSDRLLSPSGQVDGAAQEDLLTDLVAAMGSAAEVAAHAFRFARFSLTSTILAGGGGLLETARPTQRGVREDDGATSARVQELLHALATGPRTEVSVPTQRGSAVALRTARIGELIDKGVLRRLPGNRFEDVRVATGVPGEVRLIGEAELAGDAAVGSRVVDRMELAARYPASRLTEPGDVVFTVARRPAAMVDHEGFSVVAFPAQVLRVEHPEVGLVPGVLARDIAARVWPPNGGGTSRCGWCRRNRPKR